MKSVVPEFWECVREAAQMSKENDCFDLHSDDQRSINQYRQLQKEQACTAMRLVHCVVDNKTELVDYLHRMYQDNTQNQVDKLWSLIQQACGDENGNVKNIGNICLHPEIMNLIADFVVETMNMGNLKHVCCMNTEAMPLLMATLMIGKQRHMDINGFLVRDTGKSYGAKQQIEGHYEPGAKVLVLDTEAYTGRSLLRTCNQIRNHGFQVRSAMVVMSWNSAAEGVLKKDEIKLSSIFRE